MIRPSSSKPLSSVPSRWPAVGARSVTSGFVSTWSVWYSSGPMKQTSTNSRIRTTLTTASLLLVNSRSARRQPLAMTWTSPPSGAVAGKFGEPSLGTPSIRGSAPRSAKADPRVGDRHGDVGQQVADHGQDPADDRVGQQDRVVDVAERV